MPVPALSGAALRPARPARPAVVFDLDGTLVDSEPAYYAAAREVLAAHGVADFTWEDHAAYVGIGTRETLLALRERHGIERDVEELLAAKNAAYLRRARRTAVPYPGMLTFVRDLVRAGHPVAVASGSSRDAIDAVLAGTPLDALLPVRVSAEEVPHGKPAPDVFLAAARGLGVPAAACVAVEDAVPGVLAARRAGMRCIAVPYLRATARDPVFAAADLLFPDGQDSFDPTRAYAWLVSGGSERHGVA